MTWDKTPDPSTQETITVIHRFNEAFNRKDVDAIMTMMTLDCVFENTFPPPDGEQFRGSAAVRRFWEALFGRTADTRFEWEEVFACGDRAVVRWTYHWTGAGEQAGHVRGVDILRVRDGKVAEKLSYVKG